MLFADNVEERVFLVSDAGGWVAHGVIQLADGVGNPFLQRIAVSAYGTYGIL
jgi:hypothetical protein